MRVRGVRKKGTMSGRCAAMVAREWGERSF